MVFLRMDVLNAVKANAVAPRKTYPCLPFELDQRQKARLCDPLCHCQGGEPEIPSPNLGTGEGAFLDVCVLCEVCPKRSLRHSVSQSNPPHVLRGRGKAQRG